MKNVNLSLVTALILLSIIGCSSGPQKPTEESKPAAEQKPAFQEEHYTGREALQKMYIAARSWSVDAKPYSLNSQPTKSANGQDGKSGIWQAGFASPSKRAVKVFSWSGIKADDAPEPGINSKPSDTYNPANTSTEIFDIAFLKKDSTDAIEVAQKHGGEKLLKKSSDMEVSYDLVWNGRENKLVWRVLYGPSASERKLAVDVDASTGEFIKVEK